MIRRRRTTKELESGSNEGDSSPFGGRFAFDLRSDPLLHDVPVAEGYKMLGPCVLYRRLGRGGMGVVYLGRHLNLDVDVAVKCLDPGLVERNEQFVARFRREARIAARINHPNVVRVYDVSEENGVHYIVMEYVDGEDARRRVVRKGPLSVGETLAIILGAGSGLSEAHRRQMVHRDVKPDNILVSTAGLVKIADLGLAKIARGETEVTQVKSRLGTPNYMPLEQWESLVAVGPETDVWALGATTYFLLASEDAIGGETDYEILGRLSKEPFPDIRRKRPDLPLELVRIIERATQKDPSARYPTAGEFVEALQGLSALGVGDLRDPSATRGLDSHGFPPPPAGETLERIKAGLPARAGSGSPRVDTRPRISRKKKAALGIGIATLAVITLLSLVLSRTDRKGDPASGEKAGSGQQVEPGRDAPASDARAGAAPPAGMANRTDYMMLWTNQSGERIFIKPTVDETVAQVHWFGEASCSLAQIPPARYSPDQVIDVRISWEWVDIESTPLTCIDVYGDWRPDAWEPNTNELYHESIVLPPGGPTPHTITFSFTAPERPGMYRIRWMYTYCFDDSHHISSFYGGKKAETNVAPAEAWTELLFEVTG